jgi:Ca2+-binding EF-hand superfamily protein
MKKSKIYSETKGTMKTSVIVMALALGLSAIATHAQDNDQQGDKPRLEGGPNRRGPGGPGGPGSPGGRPMIPPVIAALDADHDGTIDESELAKASESLKALDKNGDGKLTGDELRPQMGPRPGGPRPDGGGSPDGNREGGPRHRPSPDGDQGSADGGRPRGPRPDGQGFGGQGDHKPMIPPLIKALDANGDGTIDEVELSQATEHLKALDKNNDGKLTRDEVGGPNRQHGPGPKPE